MGLLAFGKVLSMAESNSGLERSLARYGVLVVVRWIKRGTTKLHGLLRRRAPSALWKRLGKEGVKAESKYVDAVAQKITRGVHAYLDEKCGEANARTEYELQRVFERIGPQRCACKNHGHADPHETDDQFSGD